MIQMQVGSRRQKVKDALKLDGSKMNVTRPQSIGHVIGSLIKSV